MPKRPEAHGVPPALATPTDLGANATRDIAAALNGLLADVFALYLKTKNFHWHMSGPRFSRLPLDARRAVRPDLRDDRRAGRTGARGARNDRRTQRCGDREPAGGVHRQDRVARLVPVRDEPRRAAPHGA